MRHLPNDKYNVAWFKLAEFVARGEKERALGLYRLLVHSFNDKALAIQLEGDILLSFNDAEAVECYQRAAEQYVIEEKITQAAAVHEHILMLKADCAFSIKKLLEFYEGRNKAIRVLELLEMLSAVLVAKRNYHEVTSLIEKYEAHFSSSQLLPVYKKIVITSAQEDFCDENVVFCLHKALDELIDNTQEMQKFMESIKAMNEKLYHKACEYLKK